jgi:hypothetical protein
MAANWQLVSDRPLRRITLPSSIPSGIEFASQRQVWQDCDGSRKVKASSARKHQEGGSDREEKADDCAPAKKDEDRMGKQASSVAKRKRH